MSESMSNYDFVSNSFKIAAESDEAGREAIIRKLASLLDKQEEMIDALAITVDRWMALADKSMETPKNL